MESNNETVIFLAVLILVTSAVIIIKAVEFFTEFNREIRYIKMEMKRAGDRLEFRYWRRELRCRRLMLLPFVNEKNVRRLYGLLYHGRRRT